MYYKSFGIKDIIVIFIFTMLIALVGCSPSSIMVNNDKVAAQIYKGQYLSGIEKIIEDNFSPGHENYLCRLFNMNISSSGKTNSLVFSMVSKESYGNSDVYTISIDAIKGQYKISKMDNTNNAIMENEVSINTAFSTLEQVDMDEIINLSHVKSSQYSTYTRVFPPHTEIGSQYVSFVKPVYFIKRGVITPVQEPFITATGGILLELIPGDNQANEITFFFYNFLPST